jgi:IS5 family transposase
VLRTVNAQPTLWEALLPEMCLGLPAELEAVDRLLDDPVFFAPYRRHFHPIFGRPSVPIETYLRLMFLKFRYKLGFEPLCREVADSISWQRFCRIPLGVTVPHPTTLMKITTRCGPRAIIELNNALLAKAAEARVLKTNKVRADTTVVEANVAYPSDSSLLAKGVAKMAKTTKKLQALGFAARTKLADRTRSVLRRARSINANLNRRSDDRLLEVRRINSELVRIARRVAQETDAIVSNARRTLRHRPSGRARRLVTDLARCAELTRTIADQTAERMAGGMPAGSRRIVSLHDADARAIKKGRLGRPVEFGYKAQLVDNIDGGDPRPQRRGRQSTGRLDARTSRPTHHGSHRASTSCRHRRPGLWRPRCRAITARGWRPLHRAADEGQTERCSPSGREAKILSGDGPLEDRMRRTDQLRETRLRTRPHPPRRHRRGENVVRARHIRPQPGEDQHADHDLREVAGSSPNSLSVFRRLRRGTPSLGTISGRSS